MTDLKNGIIEIFSKKIYLGMPYEEAIYVLKDNIKSNEVIEETYGFIDTKRTAVMGLKSADCRMLFVNLKLSKVTFGVTPTFDEYIKNVPQERLSRDYFYDQIDKLFKECVQYINNYFTPSKVINVRAKRIDYVFDQIIMSVAMDRDNEGFSIIIGEYHE